MKIKTNELTGPALDWAVLQCLPDDLKGDSSAYDRDDQWGDFSTDWSQGGPIIEREKLNLVGPYLGKTQWMCYYFRGPVFLGPTPLVTAMRCFIASKLGDEVEISKELIKNP